MRFLLPGKSNAIDQMGDCCAPETALSLPIPSIVYCSPFVLLNLQASLVIGELWAGVSIASHPSSLSGRMSRQSLPATTLACKFSTPQWNGKQGGGISSDPGSSLQARGPCSRPINLVPICLLIPLELVPSPSPQVDKRASWRRCMKDCTICCQYISCCGTICYIGNFFPLVSRCSFLQWCLATSLWCFMLNLAFGGACLLSRLF